MEASPIYLPSLEYLRAYGGMEGYKNPVIFRFFLKLHDRRSEYNFADSCSLHDHVDDRNGNSALPLLLKKFKKGWQKCKDKRRTNISFVSYCTSRLWFVPKACLKYFLLFFFLGVIIMLEIVEWWWLHSHFWWAA